MDNRTVLRPGSILSFPGMICEIEKLIGKGSNAIVYLGRYEDSLSLGLFHHVIIKELFPYHPESSIRRNESGDIEADESAADYFDLQKKSFECGNEIHLRMLEKHPDKIGANINTFPLNGTFYSVLGFDSGKSLDKAEANVRGLRNIVLLLRDIIDAVEIFHLAGYLHLDISPDNILLIGEGDSRRVSLIDYNSIHKMSDIHSGNALYCSAKDGYTAPEVLSGNLRAFCQGSDIYSVTAVFYRLLTGKRLSFYQSLCKKPPDIKGCPLLEGVPDTVVSRIALILRRGLCSLPSKRYKDCESIRKDVTELLSRIDGTGITHAALWESSRRIIEKTVSTNPSLRYLKNEDSLYPIRLTDSENRSSLLYEAIEAQLKQGSAIINGAAGTGKTTALLHTAVTKSRHYSPLQPATVYVSLFDYNSNGDNFIKNRILEDLKFDSNVSSTEDARSRLIKEFDSPLMTKEGEKARYLLLIDGFNEADGDTEPLINEILSLSKMKGVRLLLTSRSNTDAFPFPSLTLSELTESDIKAVLSKNRLLYPESQQMQQLLKTPLMLSMFCKAALSNEKQLSCKSSDELISAYLNGIIEKEVRALPEDSPKRWMIDAAVNFVLPFVCAEISRKNRAVTDGDLIKAINKCFRLVSSGRLTRLMPQYIGHSRDIRDTAQNAEEWYGAVVIKLLWHKTGLLVKEPDRGYRLMHQLLQQELTVRHRKINSQIRKQNFLLYGFSAAALTALIILLSSFIAPDTFDEKLAETYLDSIVVSQVQSAGEISTLTRLLQADPDNNPIYTAALHDLKSKLELHNRLLEDESIGSGEMSEKIYQQLKSTGKVMPWSKQAVNEGDVRSLFELGEEIAQSYGLYADVLDFLSENKQLDIMYGEAFRSRLEEKLSADAALSDALFYSACTVHLEKMKKSNPEGYEHYWLTIGEKADLSDSEPTEPDKAAIEKLRKDSSDKALSLNELEIFVIYRRTNQ